MRERVLRWGILAGSISMIVFGVYREEVDVVFRKAINVCLECIGIG